MSDREVVYIEKNGPVAQVVLNQPHKKNAISAVMMDMLTRALDQLENDDEVKVIALRGEGDNFCAGGDLDQPGPKPMTAEFSSQRLRRYIPVSYTHLDVYKRQVLVLWILVLLRPVVLCVKR